MGWFHRYLVTVIGAGASLRLAGRRSLTYSSSSSSSAFQTSTKAGSCTKSPAAPECAVPCLNKTVWQLDLNPKASLLKETSSLQSVFHIFSPSLHCKSLFSFALLKQHRTDWPEYEYEYEYSNCEETQHNLPWFYSSQ